MKRMQTILLAIVILMQSILLLPVHAEEFTDSSSMTDAEFFGEWDEENGEWKTKGKLNYTNFPALSEVEHYARLGEYQNAKSEFLYYMKNRPPLLPSSNYSTNYTLANLWCDNIVVLPSNTVADTFTVSGGDFAEYRIDVSDIVKRRGSFSFMLMQRFKSEEAAEVCARESGFSPTLEIHYQNQSKVYSVSKDTYIATDNMKEAHGSEQYMYVKESTDSDIANPYWRIFGKDTKRAYIQFNVSGLDYETVIDGAYITLRARSAGEKTSLILFREGATIWKENSFCWNDSETSILSFNGTDMDFSKLPDRNEFGFGDTKGLARWQWATTMAGCYISSGDEVYAENLIRIINEFIRSTRDKVYSYDGMQDTSMRLNLFVNVYNDLLRSDAMDADSNTAFVKNLWQLTKYLSYSANYRPDHNHGCFVVRGQEKACNYFPEFSDRTEWMEQVIYRWNELAKNLMQSGDYREGTTAYAGTVLNIFNNTLTTAEYYGYDVGDEFKKNVRQLAWYLANVSFPNGRDIQLGDSDYVDVFGYVRKTAELLEDDELQYIVSAGEEGTAPGQESLYINGRNKLTVMRSGWTEDDRFLAVNAASADGRSHTHPDNLSVAVYAYGNPLIVDTGRNNYNDSTVSNWLRMTTEAHNTVTIDSRVQSIGSSGDVELFKTNKYFDTYKGIEGTVQPFVHNRRIMFVKPYFWIISDYVTGTDQSEHTYDQNWHFTNTANITLDGNILTTDFETGGNLKLINVDNPEISGTLRRGYYSPNESGTVEANYLTFTQSIEHEPVFDTLLFPQERGSNDDISAQRLTLDVPLNQASAYLLDMALDNREAYAVVYTSHETVPKRRQIGAQYTFDGIQLYAEQDKTGRLQALNMIGGTLLERGGQPIVNYAGGDVGDISIVYDSDKVEIFSETVTAETLKNLTIYADKPYREVFFNGGQAVFYQNENVIYFKKNEGGGSVVNKPNGGSSSGSSGGGGMSYGSGVLSGSKTPSEESSNSNDNQTAIPPVLENKDVVFIDIENHWAKDDILFIAEKGIARGDEKGHFHPDMPVTRAEFAAFILRLLNEEENADAASVFEDVLPDVWYAGSVGGAYALEIVQGADGKFLPNDYITREEAAVMLSRLAIVDRFSYEEALFTDSGEISDWAREGVAKICSASIMQGVSADVFAPKETADRAQIATMLRRMYHLLYREGENSSALYKTTN